MSNVLQFRSMLCTVSLGFVIAKTFFNQFVCVVRLTLLSAGCMNPQMFEEELRNSIIMVFILAFSQCPRTCNLLKCIQSTLWPSIHLQFAELECLSLLDYYWVHSIYIFICIEIISTSIQNLKFINCCWEAEEPENQVDFAQANNFTTCGVIFDISWYFI